jgi:type 1 glutamine amidotransferase
LLLGDNVLAQYHPLQAVEKELMELLQDRFAIDSTEDYEIMSGNGLAPYDLCIVYTDRWGIPAASSQVGGLLGYVAGGGGLLILHNGISLQARYEISQLIGAKFTGHPPYAPLAFHITDVDHEIVRGIEDFTMEEEPYRFETDPFTETTVLLEYAHDGARRPAAWAHEFGLGRVAYLMPGHHIYSLKHPMYRKLIVQSGLWASSSGRG